MIRYPMRARILAICLAAQAGFVDATAFIHLGGFFVSFMSGNTTRLGVSLAMGSAQAAFAGAVIATFVLGVVLGSLIGRAAKEWRGPAVLLTVAVLLATAACLTQLGFLLWAAVPMALAMGAENAVFEQDGEVGIGLTYMTGALVKAGQKLAYAFGGGAPLAWAPYALLWLGLASGGVLGALAHTWLKGDGLWLGAAIAAGLTIASARMGVRAHEPLNSGRKEAES